MTTPSADAIAKRDALLEALEGHYEELLEATRSGEPETVDALLVKRQTVIDDLTAIASDAPIPPSLGPTLAEREKTLQHAVRQQLQQARGAMRTSNRQGQAALRYRRSR